jgi:endonuclease/exonuclease/phosphatase family metal-dependent hydrolase
VNVRPITRRSLIAATATVAVAAGVSGSPAHAAAPRRPSRRLRVVSYNIQHGVDFDGVLDLERQTRFLEGRRADIIGLQEVDRHWSERSEWLDQAAWFGERLGLAHAYGANLDREPPEPGLPRRQYGTAVLSKWPITWWRNTYLPWEEGTEQRGLLEIEVDFHGVPLRFANTHLQHRAEDAELRLAQAQRIVELLGASPRRAFLAGDLNAVPETPELKVLTDVLVDAWEAVGHRTGYTYPAGEPDRRIDYLLGSPDARPLRAEIPSTLASDHLPVTVDYLVR